MEVAAEGRGGGEWELGAGHSRQVPQGTPRCTLPAARYPASSIPFVLVTSSVSLGKWGNVSGPRPG